MKQLRKSLWDMGKTTIAGAGISTALGSIPGTIPTYGQAGIQNALGVMPMIGNVIGAAAVARQASQFGKKKRRR